jgi:pimeloyl-ACP methyl ester carboxylesterase
MLAGMKLPACLLPFLAMSAFAADFPSPEKLPASAALPDPLVMRDGTRVTTKEQWLTKRAPELRELFAHYMYGARPQPRAVSGKIIREDKAALGGKVTLREVLVDCGLGAPVHLLVVVPNGATKPAPCFLGMNFYGNHQVLDDPKIQMPRGWVPGKSAAGGSNQASEADRGKQTETWAIEQSVARGYAVATFFSGDVVPDDKVLAEAVLKQFRASGSEERGPADTATIMAWSWGFSRMLDYLLTVPEIDGKRVAVVGHSRNGKTALVAAAFDERIALAIPSQAGCGGTAPDRVAPELAAPQSGGRPTVETLPVINKAFPHWFSGNFKSFNEAIPNLPFDQHALLALCAPRPVLYSNATEDKWANPPGQFEMMRAAEPVYRLFHADNLGAERMPEVGHLLDSRLGYFIREGKHSMTTPDWKVWCDFADKWLK